MDGDKPETAGVPSLPPRLSNAELVGLWKSLPWSSTPGNQPPSPPPPPPDHKSSEPRPPKPDFWTSADKGMFGLCELLALLFGLPFGEDLYHGNPITGWHWFYLVIAILFAAGGPMWPWIRTREWMPEKVSTSLSKVGSDARIWVAVLLLLFVYVTGPEIYRRATKPLPISGAIEVAPAPTAQPISTMLRLQFNAAGAAQEIEAKNLKWHVINPEETRLAPAPLLALCPNGDTYVRKPTTGLTSVLDPAFCFQKIKTWIFLLSFEKPITYKKISANAHGATLPDWDNKGMTENSATVWFHGELKNLVLTIEAVD
jgi:hypothetical protein